MRLSAALKSSNLISWKSSGRFQQTLGRQVKVTGKCLHSGKEITVTIKPELAGKGRYFDFKKSTSSIPASIDYVLKNTPLCTTLFNQQQQIKVATVEHLLSALEATGIDNCSIQIINNSDNDVDDCNFEVPILDGSAKKWVETIIEDGSIVEAVDESGSTRERLSPYLKEPVYVQKNDSFVVAFPSDQLCITYGIDFSRVGAIGRQWYSVAPLDYHSYIKEIASSRTFCILEEVEHMRKMGLIKGGSLDNAIVCSDSKGWLNPPLHFSEEPCRHKILDLVGDLSLLARSGNQGLPVAHIIAYKGGHSLHADFARCLNESLKS